MRCAWFFIAGTANENTPGRYVTVHVPLAGCDRGHVRTEIRDLPAMSKYNVLSNLQLLTDSENLSKNATPFDKWIHTRDPTFRKRHLIPDMPTYDLDSFEKFLKGRTALIVAALKDL